MAILLPNWEHSDYSQRNLIIHAYICALCKGISSFILYRTGFADEFKGFIFIWSQLDIL
jgi:hypothetical protein